MTMIGRALSSDIAGLRRSIVLLAASVRAAVDAAKMR
jgi:hypothetical protein